MHNKCSTIVVSLLVLVYIGRKVEVPCVTKILKLVDPMHDRLVSSIQLVDAMQLDHKESSESVA